MHASFQKCCFIYRVNILLLYGYSLPLCSDLSNPRNYYRKWYRQKMSQRVYILESTDRKHVLHSAFPLSRSCQNCFYALLCYNENAAYLVCIKIFAVGRQDGTNWCFHSSFFQAQKKEIREHYQVCSYRPILSFLYMRGLYFTPSRFPIVAIYLTDTIPQRIGALTQQIQLYITFI